MLCTSKFRLKVGRYSLTKLTIFTGGSGVIKLNSLQNRIWLVYEIFNTAAWHNSGLIFFLDIFIIWFLLYQQIIASYYYRIEMTK